VGKGSFYYIASRNDVRFHSDFYRHLISSLGIVCPLESDLPDGVTAAVRTDGVRKYLFLLNFTNRDQRVDLGGASRLDLLTGAMAIGTITLKGYSFRVFV
jgi:beta-galactosidase